MLNSNLSKTVVLFVLLSLPVVTFVRAEEKPGTEAKAPAAKFPEIRFDAGTVQDGAIVTHDFVILNEGNATLKIEELVPS